MKSQKGISLVALVIMVIVLLVLAAVAVASLSGDNGLFNIKKQSTNNTLDVENDRVYNNVE